MSESGIKKLAAQLLERISTTTELKQVSVALESLSQSRDFKSSAQLIASDSRLSYAIKKTQILFLLKDIHNPTLYAFFSDLFSEHEFWMFSSAQFDYFDEFVQAFQMLTEKVTVVNIVTAVDVEELDLVQMSKRLAKALENQVVLHPQVNPAIIGGAQIKIGNLIFDYSLRSKFHQFQRQWVSQIEKTAHHVGSR
jgi:F0F1-type ATP synthase delta subunit